MGPGGLRLGGPRDSRLGGGAYTAIVGVDGSPSSRSALQRAAAEAGARHGRIRALHAWTSPSRREIEGLEAVDEEKFEAVLQERLDEAVAGVDTGAVTLDAELVEG